MKRIVQRIWHVLLSLPKQYEGKMFSEKSAGQAENLYFGEQGNFAGQRFMNLGGGDEKLHNPV